MFQVITYKQNIVKHDATEEVICPYETDFLQFVGDNTDHEMEAEMENNLYYELTLYPTSFRWCKENTKE